MRRYDFECDLRTTVLELIFNHQLSSTFFGGNRRQTGIKNALQRLISMPGCAA